MTIGPERGLLEFLEQVPDSRGRQGQRHSLSAMLAAVVCAVLCGCRGYRAMAQWVHLQEPPTWHLLGFWRRPPTWYGFRKVLMKVDPEALQQALGQWLASLGLTPSDEVLQAVALDGKVLRGTRSPHARAVTLLAFLDQQTGCVLSQTPVKASTNESKAALEFLKQLVLKGKLIVGDAAFCQRDVCEKLLEDEGEYLLVVKDNQPNLHRAAQQAFVIPRAFSPLPSAAGTGSPHHRDDDREKSRTPGSPHTDHHDGGHRALRLAGRASVPAAGTSHHP